MMCEDDIKQVDAWFEQHTEYYGTNGDTRTLMSILYKDYDYEMKLMDEERNQSLDDLHDYASGNDLKRALGHPELQKERELPNCGADMRGDQT